MEDNDDDDTILTPKQIKILTNVIRNMAGYFGLYTISGELDKHI